MSDRESAGYVQNCTLLARRGQRERHTWQEIASQLKYSLQKLISANVKQTRDLFSAMPSHSESNSLQRAAAAALNAVGKHVDLDARVTVSPAWATHTAAAFGASSSALLDDRVLAGSSVGAVGIVERALLAIFDLVVLALTLYPPNRSYIHQHGTKLPLTPHPLHVPCLNSWQAPEALSKLCGGVDVMSEAEASGVAVVHASCDIALTRRKVLRREVS